MSHTDANIWSQFLAGDDNAFTHIYNTNIESLFLYGLQFSKNRELVKDAIQDLFVKLYVNRSTIKPTTNIKFYLFTSLRNTMYNMFRKDIVVDHTDELESKVIEDSTPLEKVLEQENDELIKVELNKIFDLLSTRQREVLFYRFIEGFTFAEIEAIMGINYQSIHNLIQQAIKKVRTSSNLNLSNIL